MAQSSWIDRPLKRDTKIAAITSSISAAWLLPATRARRAEVVARSSCSLWSSRANACTSAGAVGLAAALSSSIHCTRCSTNSATGAGSPKCSWREGQSTTTRQWWIVGSCCSSRAVSA